MNSARANSNIQYTCTTGIDIDSIKPPTAIDTRCFPEYDAETVTNRCTGEVSSDTFFQRVSMFQKTIDQFYAYRHKTLFNLYAFDEFRSHRTHTPTLDIVNCTFSYFLDKHNSLIQVETNNLDSWGVTYSYDDNGALVVDTTDEFYVMHGEDRGAKITITDSQFKHMTFCRGMIWYRRQEAMTYDNYPTFVNISAQLTNDKREYDPYEESYIRIRDSEFDNFGFLQAIQALRLVADSQSIYGAYTWQNPMNQGMILNV
jgi:hypothetical protein